MKLFIQIQNDQPIDHPITEENLLQLFPDFDLNSLPEGWTVFERVEAPIPGVYEVPEHLGYVWDGNVVKDHWNLRSMTEEEKLHKQNSVKRAWIESNISKTWTFDENTCRFIPPVPYPSDGNAYEWNEMTQNWQVIPKILRIS